MTWAAQFETQKSGFDATVLSELLDSTTKVVKDKLEQIKDNGSSISIADMFDVQIMMNRLSQFSEMSTSVLAAANTSIQSMARNVKG